MADAGVLEQEFRTDEAAPSGAPDAREAAARAAAWLRRWDARVCGVATREPLFAVGAALAMGYALGLVLARRQPR